MTFLTFYVKEIALEAYEFVFFNKLASKMLAGAEFEYKVSLTNIVTTQFLELLLSFPRIVYSCRTCISCKIHDVFIKKRTLKRNLIFIFKCVACLALLFFLMIVLLILTKGYVVVTHIAIEYMQNKKFLELST